MFSCFARVSRLVVCSFVATAFGAAAFAQTTVPLGAAQTVNRSPLLTAQHPAVDADAEGGFVVVWAARAPDGPANASVVQARRFAPDGMPLDVDLQISPQAGDLVDAIRPRLNVGADGQFVVVWYDNNQGSVHGRKFHSDGTPSSTFLDVSDELGGSFPDVALTAEGGFFAVWQSSASSGDDDSQTSIQGRLFSSDGVPQTDVFQLNSYTTNGQGSASVVRLSDGGFAVTWASFGSAGGDASRHSVQLRLFDSVGFAANAEIQVSQMTPNDQFNPRLAVSASGELMVTWESEATIPPQILGRRLDSASGLPIGNEFRVNDVSLAWPYAPDVAMSDDGESVFAWSDAQTAGKRFDNDDLQVGNTLTVGSHYYEYDPQIAAQKEGRFLVVWDDDHGDIKARLYDRDTDEDGVGDSSDCAPEDPQWSTCLFVDGFESGDLSGWSSGS